MLVSGATSRRFRWATGSCRSRGWSRACRRAPSALHQRAVRRDSTSWMPLAGGRPGYRWTAGPICRPATSQSTPGTRRCQRSDQNITLTTMPSGPASLTRDRATARAQTHRHPMRVVTRRTGLSAELLRVWGNDGIASSSRRARRPDAGSTPTRRSSDSISCSAPRSAGAVSGSSRRCRIRPCASCSVRMPRLTCLRAPMRRPDGSHRTPAMPRRLSPRASVPSNVSIPMR